MRSVARRVAMLQNDIERALQRLQKARDELETVTKRHQAACLHSQVVEVPWAGSGLSARRMCARCCIEEEGSHWSGGTTWSRCDYERPVLGNREGRTISILEDRSMFYRMRLPGVPANCEPAEE